MLNFPKENHSTDNYLGEIKDERTSQNFVLRVIAQKRKGKDKTNGETVDRGSTNYDASQQHKPQQSTGSLKSLFKEKVHTTLLKIFEVQDSYADLNTIISDFKNY